jgi:hypothetical protein
MHLKAILAAVVMVQVVQAILPQAEEVAPDKLV